MSSFIKWKMHQGIFSQGNVCIPIVIALSPKTHIDLPEDDTKNNHNCQIRNRRNP